MCKRRYRCALPMARALPFALVCIAVTGPAVADDTGKVVHQVAQLFAGVGGCFFTSSSAEKALGTPKFSGFTEFLTRPAHRGPVQISGGFQLFGAGDHWQPFSGGNRYSLTGAVMRVQVPPRMDRLAPFVEGGVYYGEINSDRLNYYASSWVPSVSLGAEYRFARYVRVSASYRVSGKFGGVNADGFYAGIGIF